jgi:type VI secretion system protein ImpM
VPGKSLSGEPLGDAFEPHAGFHGKMPAAGDFVSRGLAPILRSRWDGWATRHLARWEGPWPEGGLRLRLPSGSRGLVALVMPSADGVGRRFPLAALAVTAAPPPVNEAEAWCAGAWPPLAGAASGALGPDALEAALAPLPLPQGLEEGAGALAWTARGTPVPLDPADPGPALAALSSGGSPSR